MGRAERVPPTGTRGMRHFWRRVVRWDARSAFPLRALAKAAVLRTCSFSFARSPYGHSRNAALLEEGSPVGRVPQGTRSPYGHSQKRLTPMA